MSSRIPALLLGAALLLTQAAAREIQCASAAARRAAAAEGSALRQYAPRRTVDILHLALDVTPDWHENSIQGTASFRFKSLPTPAEELVLDARDLRVSAVRSSAPIAGHQNTGEEIIITFKEPLQPEVEYTLEIDYKAFPRQGLYFRTAAMGYSPEDEHIYTQGEAIEARHWYPSYDSPGEKFSTQVACTVPEHMVVLSNGRLVSETPAGSGLKKVTWRQEKPHVNYLISLVAGNFKKIEDDYNGLDLAFYTPSSEIQYAENSFRETKEMLAFFENEIGFPYPWHKYYQVCVQDYAWGGMEHTSVTTLNHRTLFPDATENIRSSQGLVAHELAHQWFGDLVTCEDWNHIWLNEGFAVYYTHLYSRHKNGHDDFLYGLYDSASGIVSRSAERDSEPIVRRNFAAPVNLFRDTGYLIYPKGGWILHMLRSQMGEDLFRQAVLNYTEAHAYDSADTHDLIQAVENVSGRSWDRFFDQWVFHPHHPELKATYSWDEKARLARVTIDQVQPLTNGISLFHFPLKLRFKGDFETVDHDVFIDEKSETFHIPLPDAPKIVRIDPEYTLLAKIDFSPPRPLVLAQFEDDSDMIGRLLALKQLAKSQDADTIKQIGARLRNDPFYGIRIEAAQALKEAKTPDALQALLASADQPDARVRQQVVMAIGSYFNPAALEFALKTLEREKNPDIIHHAVLALSHYPSAEAKERLAASLQSESYRNVVADAAVAALKSQADPAAIPLLAQAIETGEGAFTSRGFGEALEAIAYLARDEGDKSAVLELLLPYASHKKETIQLAAFSALATLQDERAIPVLSTFASGAEDDRLTQRAERAIESIRSARKTVAELGDIRSELLSLKRQNEELQESLDELKKEVEALPPAEEKRSRGWFFGR